MSVRLQQIFSRCLIFSYLLRREHTNRPAVFSHCYTHFCQQGLSVDGCQNQYTKQLYVKMLYSSIKFMSILQNPSVSYLKSLSSYKIIMHATP